MIDAATIKKINSIEYLAFRYLTANLFITLFYLQFKNIFIKSIFGKQGKLIVEFWYKDFYFIYFSLSILSNLTCYQKASYFYFMEA